MQREEERKRKAAKMDHASVYIAIACKVEVDSGSDYNRSQYVKDNVDQEILGVFFSKRQANRCAKERAYQDEDMDSEEEEGDEDGDDSVDVDTFVNDPHDDWDDDMMYEKVWVERRTIEDASYDFHTQDAFTKSKIQMHRETNGKGEVLQNVCYMSLFECLAYFLFPALSVSSLMNVAL